MAGSSLRSAQAVLCSSSYTLYSLAKKKGQGARGGPGSLRVGEGACLGREV